MEIRVSGCDGSQLPGFGLTGFLIGKVTLLDAGAVTVVLTAEVQARVEHVIIIHAHLITAAIPPPWRTISVFREGASPDHRQYGQVIRI
jgi:hypothetical protein